MTITRKTICRIAGAAVTALLLAGCLPPGAITINPGPGIGGGGGGGGGIAPPAPTVVEATFTRSASCKGRRGRNGGRGVGSLDGSCYSCPSGYRRTIFPAKSRNACEKGGPPPFGTWVRAEKLGRPGCRAGEFQVGDGCYTCPSGTSRRGSRQCVRR